MEYSKYLNDEQLKGVTCLSKYTKVVAGAGSGKTRVLTYRIAYLLDEMNALDSQIMGITFTNKAAKEIKDRVGKLVPEARYLNLSTIHSWCARFLRRYIDALNYPKNFTILDEDDQLSVMKNLYVEAGRPKNDPAIKKCLGWISSKKEKGLQYKDLQNENYPNAELREYLKFFGLYDERLMKINALDFDDLLIKTIEILKEPNGVKNTVTNRIKHILVDEFQDINDLQFELITLLMNKDTSLYVVGDPDQTIYTWRGANNDIMINLEEKLRYYVNKDAIVNEIFLVNNYRSSANILNSANNLIAHNVDRIKKDLIAINEEGSNIELYRADSGQQEAAYIASMIKEGHLKGKDYNDYAILYRANYLTRELEAQLLLNHIPYRIFGGMKFFQRKEIKDVLAYLTLFVNNDNDVAFERIINVPKRNIGPGSIETLKQEALENSSTLFYYVKENIDSSSLPNKKKEDLTHLIHTITRYQNEIESAKSEDYGDIVDEFIEEIHYYDYLKEDDDKGDERIDNVKELIGSIKGFYKVNPNSNFSDFMENAALQSSQDDLVDGNYVSLMTVHTAKGLEFDTVFIYSFNDGVFPSIHSLEESSKGEEEERRLAYVAITRAKKKLYLTCNSEFNFVVGTRTPPSRFIKEAGLKIPSMVDNMPDYLNSYQNSSYKRNNIYVKPAVNKVLPPVRSLNSVNQTNGVKSWSVGDKLIHENFGVGEVISVVSPKLIKVRFENDNAEKTLLSSHIKIKKLVA